MDQNELAAQQMEAMKKALLDKVISKEARERLNTIRVAHPQLAQQVEVIIMQAVQSGQLQGVLDDKGLKIILNQVIPDKKEFKVLRK